MIIRRRLLRDNCLYFLYVKVGTLKKKVRFKMKI